MISEQPNQHVRTTTVAGTRDGEGAADHDLPYRFGRRPSIAAPFPFSTHQYARLLILRSRVHADAPIQPPVAGR